MSEGFSGLLQFLFLATDFLLIIRLNKVTATSKGSRKMDGNSGTLPLMLFCTVMVTLLLAVFPAKS
jgi:hypothetical protein